MSLAFVCFLALLYILVSAEAIVTNTYSHAHTSTAVFLECLNYTVCFSIIYSITTLGKMKFTALVPVVLSLVALILSFLCMFAGSKRSFMVHYPIVTVSKAPISPAQGKKS